jgi:phosphatidylserine/phosphatidylglycerophosphate/cardiolipin synthase-like enzyme
VPVTGRPPVALKLTLALPLVCLAGCGLGPPDAGPARAGRPVALIVEPDAGADAILSLVAAARTSVWMEMYLLTDARAIAALADRARAGCDVRVILEPSPYLNEDANQAAADALTAAGALVRWASPRFSYTHAKTLIVDHARLVVMTLNLTGAGLGGNREYAAVDDDAGDVAAAEAVFAADETGDVAVAGGRLITSPDASRGALTGLIAEAALSLAIETEELTDRAIIAALLEARARGVAVTLVWPGPPDAGAAFATLAAAGATVRALAEPTIHAKVVVADGRALYLGSANFTPTSLDRNRELGLKLDDAGIAQRIGATVADDAARGLPP